ASRAGETTLRALITERVAPGVVYTTFHHPDTQANVITTDYSDWATNCPEYKVTAVQVSPSNGPSAWQKAYDAQARHSRRMAPPEAVESREAHCGPPRRTADFSRRVFSRQPAGDRRGDGDCADLQWRHLRRHDGHAAGLAGFCCWIQPQRRHRAV